jgi:hypothetical protein
MCQPIANSSKNITLGRLLTSSDGLKWTDARFIDV